MGSRTRPISEVVLPWNGQSAFCRGREGGLIVFAWRGRPGAVPPGLATRRQLRAIGLRPNGQGAQALLWFRHRRPYRREELCDLFRVDLAAPVRPLTAARIFALDKAMAARRWCPQCEQDVGYCVPTSYGRCWTCFEANECVEAA